MNSLKISHMLFVLMLFSVVAVSFSNAPAAAMAITGDAPAALLSPDAFTSCASVTTIPVSECDALVTLYDDTNDRGWQGAPSWLVADDPCDWEGVTCASGNVVSLVLAGKRLDGTLDPSIGDLTLLQHLVLGPNYLSGSIPAEIGDLSQLQILILSHNEFTGSIPANLGSLSNLERMDINSNSLSGAIPSELGDLAALEKLDLKKNALSDPIPTGLGSLSNLSHLDLQDNNLTGQIPSDVGDLSNLLELYLNDNSLGNPGGNIPTSVGELTNVQIFDLKNNNLKGTIPAEMGDMAKVTTIDLTNNNLEGAIPPGLADEGDLPLLQQLLLSDNRLTSMPVELANLPAITNLKIDENRLEQTIPLELGDLATLQTLDLHDNDLYGGIPVDDTGDFVSLETLDLSGNDLTGSIPAELGSVANLQILNLNKNNLDGALDATIGDLVDLTRINLSQNSLNGSLPPALGNLADLELLEAWSNEFTGNLPNELADLENLLVLDLRVNDLQGPIPPQFGELDELRHLMLGNNNLSGEIPLELGELSLMAKVLLNNNGFEGGLPPELGNLNALEELRVDGNELLSGPIPMNFTNLSSLTQFQWVDTALCEPSDAGMQAWLDDLAYNNPPDPEQVCFDDYEISLGDGSALLDWTELGGDVGTYNLYRNPAPYFAITDPDTVTIPVPAPDPGPQTSYEDTAPFDPPPPTNFYYLLDALVPRDDPVSAAAHYGIFHYELLAGGTEPVLLSLGDLVWYDQNQNGLQDAGEPGYNGITVDLYENAICTGSPSASTTTGATGGDGFYEFTDLSAGDYCLQFGTIPAGWSISPVDQGDGSKDSSADGSGQIANISLTADDPDEDMGIYVSGSLGDDVSCETSAGPLANIGVSLFEDFDGDGIADGAAIDTTDSDGAGFYEFTGLQVALAGDTNNTTKYVVQVDSLDPDLGLCDSAVSPNEYNPELDSDNADDPNNDFLFEEPAP